MVGTSILAPAAVVNVNVSLEGSLASGWVEGLALSEIFVSQYLLLAVDQEQ